MHLAVCMYLSHDSHYSHHFTDYDITIMLIYLYGKCHLSHNLQIVCIEVLFITLLSLFLCRHEADTSDVSDVGLARRGVGPEVIINNYVGL